MQSFYILILTLVLLIGVARNQIRLPKSMIYPYLAPILTPKERFAHMPTCLILLHTFVPKNPGRKNIFFQKFTN